MRNGLRLVLLTLLATAPALTAQTPPPPAPVPYPEVRPIDLGGPVAVNAPLPAQGPSPASLPAQPPAPPATLQPIFPALPDLTKPAPGGVIVESPPPPVGPTRLWFRAEYLMWWVKAAPLGVSLVTTGDPQFNPRAELLSSDRQFGMFSGMRLGAGYWFDDANNFGIEGSYFFLGRRHNNFFIQSDRSGNPLLAFPFTSNTPGSSGQFLLPVASPHEFAGNVLVNAALELWGGEVNGAVCLIRKDTMELTVLGGFRYLDLRETLDISSVTADLKTSPNTISILSDSFNTRNQFYGGQMAARFLWHGDFLALDVTGKLALGSTHQVVDIQGISSQFGPTPPNGVFAGGLFAQPSNIGRYTANQFTVVPALEMKLNFVYTPRFRTFIGYDIMYWNQVVRPGNQIDRTLNLSQSAVLGTGTLNGPASPAPLFNRTDFWAQGLSLGMEVRY